MCVGRTIIIYRSHLEKTKSIDDEDDFYLSKHFFLTKTEKRIKTCYYKKELVEARVLFVQKKTRKMG